MKVIHKNSIFVLITIPILVFQLVLPITAFADDDSPTAPTDPPIVTSTPESTGTALSVTDSPTPDPVTSTPQATETIPPASVSSTPELPTTELYTPTPDTPFSPTVVPAETTASSPEDTSTPTLTPSDAATELPATEATENQSPLLETVGASSDTTNVVVLDENGNPVPLASQDAAEIIATSDPVWCLAGQAPTPGLNFCTASYPTLFELVNNERWLLNYNGTIWITSGQVADVGPVYISGGNSSLTLQGGWSGIFGDTSIGSNSVFIGSPLTIENEYSVTINNITFNNGSALIAENNVANITLNNVNIIRSPGSKILATGDIKIYDSNFNNHSWDDNPTNWGIRVSSYNIVIRNSSFNHSRWGLLVNAWNNVEIANSNFGNNSVGLDIWAYNSSKVAIKNSRFGYNYIGILVECDSAISATLSLNHVRFARNGYKTDFSYCPTGINFTSMEEEVDVDTIISADSQVEINLDCSESKFFTIDLPNGDRVTLICPVRGKARISRLDSTSLPANLPEGYTYASAFNLEIIQDVYKGTLASVITEGGYIKASFDASSLQSEAKYSILYWDVDQTTWIPLKEFMLGENGTPRIFNLKSGEPENQERKILSGVKLNKNTGVPRIEVSTNFPGIFVLVQQ